MNGTESVLLFRFKITIVSPLKVLTLAACPGLVSHFHQHQIVHILAPVAPTNKMYKTTTLLTIMFSNIVSINFLNKSRTEILLIEICPSPITPQSWLAPSY